ncbi:ATP-binding protein [Aquimarina sp. ERC-38]|uniref:hypothetical protein n=1 Tax=Aquimarina sp. ERC-38 TaxID=2949996 RepID=UPI002245C2E0|nr:hypothetical protein [Aquimarina sp. ERC-38]UZO82062.1 ATP-binding protein [Aquimarina sp. ERC-38]
MIPEINDIQKEITRLVAQSVLPVFTDQLQTHTAFLTKITALQNDLITTNSAAQSQQETFTLFLKYKQELSKTLTTYFKNLQEKNRTFPFTPYQTLLEGYVKKLPEEVVQIQAKERFIPQPDDHTLKKLKKRGKNFGYQLSILPKKIGNIFRKKEKKKVITYWEQKIAMQGIVHKQFSVAFLKEILPLLDQFFAGITATTKKLWENDVVFDTVAGNFLQKGELLSFSKKDLIALDAILNEITAIQENLQEQCKIKEQKIIQETENMLLLSGTFELPNHQFQPQEIFDQKKSLENVVLRKFVRWNTTFEILKDDWDVDLEIFSIALDTEIAFLKLLSTVSQKSGNIAASFQTCEAFLAKIITKIKSSEAQDTLKNNLRKEINNIQKTYTTKIVTPLLADFEKNEIVPKIDQFEKIQQKRIATISTKRAIADKIDFSKPNPPSAINYVSPNELITYESWPSLVKAIETTKVSVIATLNKIVQEINGLGQVIEFNLESALDLVNDKNKSENPKTVALDGMQRSTEKWEAVKDEIFTIDATIQELLREKVYAFNKNVLSFTKNENILNVRLTIAKAKSIEKSRQLRQQIKNKIIYAVPLALSFTRNKYKIASVYINSYLTKLGWLSKTDAATVASSDFLLEAQKSVEQLPFVYQRLFRSDTVQNESFFTGATLEINQIDSAWQYYLNDRYATILISGEQGAGKSSLVQRYFQKNPTRFTIKTICVANTITTDELFFKFLSEEFSVAIQNLEEAITYFTSMPKQVIVFENLQYLYLKKVKGFEVIHTLTELIAQTHLKVFWIITSSQYAFQYLEKTLQLSESFSHLITVNNSTDAVMIDAIEKRHRVSGYNLSFEEPPKAYITKKYEKASEVEKQEILKAEFYKDLNKIASGNFKIAFMYWLRSVARVENSTIYMRSLKTIDLAFIAKSSVPKTHVLNAILHHEQLTLTQIDTVTGMDPAGTRNVVRSLFENGLLVKKEAYYLINILLYRQIINLLKSKNFIH